MAAIYFSGRFSGRRPLDHHWSITQVFSRFNQFLTNFHTYVMLFPSKTAVGYRNPLPIEGLLH